VEPAVFLDRDQTLIANHGDLGDPQQVRLLPGVPEGLRALRRAGYRLVVVTNQGGVARGRYGEDDVDRVHERIAELVDELAGERDLIDRFYYCPYHPDAVLDEYRREHPWRKPHPGMLLQAARDMKLDLGVSWMVGDQVRDVTAGRAAGCRTILVGGGPDLADEARPTEAAADFADAVRIILRTGEPRSAADGPGGGDHRPPVVGDEAAPDGRTDAGRDRTPQAAAAATAGRPGGPSAVATVDDAATPPTVAVAPRAEARPGAAVRGRAAMRPARPGGRGERVRTELEAIDELRRAVGDLAEELRAERLERLDFGPFVLGAGLAQLLAVLLAVLGIMQPATGEVLLKWIGGAILAQLLVIALLLMDRRA